MEVPPYDSFSELLLPSTLFSYLYPLQKEINTTKLVANLSFKDPVAGIIIEHENNVHHASAVSSCKTYSVALTFLVY